MRDITRMVPLIIYNIYNVFSTYELVFDLIA